MERDLREEGPCQKVFQGASINSLPNSVTGGIYLIDCSSIDTIVCNKDIRVLNFHGDSNIQSIENPEFLTRILLDPENKRISQYGEVDPFSLVLEEGDIKVLSDLGLLEDFIRKVLKQEVKLQYSKFFKTTIVDSSTSCSMHKFLNHKLNVKSFIINEHSKEEADKRYPEVDVQKDLLIQEVNDFTKPNEISSSLFSRLRNFLVLLDKMLS